MQWHAGSKSSEQRPEHLELDLDGKLLSFTLLFELKPSLPLLENLTPESKKPALLVVPELSSRILEFCKEHGIACIDLNGRIWLRAPGLLVDRRSLPNRSFRYELEPGNIFVGKSARIVRCLLTDRDRNWTQSEILGRTSASSGLVSRIVQYLISQGFVEKTGSREFRLHDLAGLLDAWVESDRFAKRTRTSRYAGFIGPVSELAERLNDWAERVSVQIAFTQWIAAWHRHPYAEPVVASAYVPRLPDPATLEALGLRTVADGGKLWLHIPDDEGLLGEIQQAQGLPVVTDAQIYVDLQKVGLRGPDAAAALRSWEGFCRP